MVVAIIGELLIFPSLINILGCIMATVSFVIFQYFLKDRYILQYPFTFLLFISIFFYRYLPLIATLLEFKPITIGFERPFQTFVGETAWFLMAALAFYLACDKINQKNNFG